MLFTSYRKKTDEELMQLLASGNQRALTELYERYSRNLVRYFFRMLWKDEARAQDFLHDLFIKILEHPEHFDRTRKFSTWIFSIAHNMCKNEYRKQSLRQNVINDEWHARMVVFPPEENEFHQSLERAVFLLDEEEKNLYTLRHELEMPVEQIAMVLNCPAGTVKSRLFNLKKKIADEMMKKKT